MNQMISRGSLFDDFFRDVAPGFFVKPLHGDPLPSQVRVDIQENPESYLVQAEMPGVSKDDISVAIDGNVVTIGAEVKQRDQQSSNERVLRSERYYGSVSRSFQLAQDIDNEQSRARYENGVLQLTLPKKAATQRQRINVE